MPKKKVEATELVVSEPAQVEFQRAPRIRNEGAVEVKLPFKSFFIMQLSKDSRLKAHHAETIFVFMQGIGLKDEEPSWKYEAALRQYFGG